VSGDPGPEEPPAGAPPEAAPDASPDASRDTSPNASPGAADASPSQTITCPGCGSVFDRRYLTECCRYEAGQGYRCANCNHFLEREAAGE